MFRKTISLATSSREELVDITGEVAAIVEESGIKDGLNELTYHHHG